MKAIRNIIGLAAVAGIAAGANAQLSQLSNNNNATSIGDGGDAPSAPQSLQLTGVVRDFRADHPDFQRKPKNASGNGSFGHYMDIASDTLDDEGKPTMKSKGRKVTSQWRNALGQNVMPGLTDASYLSTMSGDASGSAEASGDAVDSAASFAQWFRDVQGVNDRKALTITLERDANSGSYVFDDSTDAYFSALNGFFPINGEMYGDYQNGINFHFTFELDTEFTYDQGSGQVFRFIGDDDVWVYIDGKKVIDLGGVHSKIDQVVELDRLAWLENGQTYNLKFFFAERHTTQSNFRVETNMVLRTVDLPATTALHD